MKKIFRPWLCALALALISNLSQAAIGLGFGTPQQTGSDVSVDVVISGLGDGIGPSVSSFDLDILFDASYLDYASTSFGDPLLGDQLDVTAAGGNPTIAETTASGVLNLYELSFDDAAALNSLQASSFTLAVVHFSVLQAGSSTLSLSLNALADADGEPLSASLSPVTVNAVPLPAAFWLMASGFAMLARFGLTTRNRSV